MSHPNDSFHSPERRRFLAQLGALGALGAVGGSMGFSPTAQATEKAAWQNWSGGQKANPANIFYPSDEAALVKAIRESSGNIRAFGGGHSFSPLCPPKAASFL